MSFNDMLTSIGAGIGTGFAASASILGAVTAFGIPVSYVANRYIYHSKGMRFLLTIVAAILSIPLLIGMGIYQLVTWGKGLAKVHYFGYMPFISQRPTESTKEEGGWFIPLLTPIWNFVRDTLFAGFIEHQDLPDDKRAYLQSMDSILLPLEKKGDPLLSVNESVVLKALEAAQQLTREDALALEEEQLASQKLLPIGARSD
jgi:hypothetical protein